MNQVKLEIQDQIATITFDRPQVLNALNSEVLRELPLAVASAKKTILLGDSQTLNGAIEAEIAAFSELFRFQDTKEGTSAFLAKRKPSFRGQ